MPNSPIPFVTKEDFDKNVPAAEAYMQADREQNTSEINAATASGFPSTAAGEQTLRAIIDGDKDFAYSLDGRKLRVKAPGRQPLQISFMRSDGASSSSYEMNPDSTCPTQTHSPARPKPGAQLRSRHHTPIP